MCLEGDVNTVGGLSYCGLIEYDSLTALNVKVYFHLLNYRTIRS